MVKSENNLHLHVYKHESYLLEQVQRKRLKSYQLIGLTLKLHT